MARRKPIPFEIFMESEQLRRAQRSIEDLSIFIDGYRENSRVLDFLEKLDD